jgi:hypothetical protein
MSETVSLEFIARRLDSVQIDTADVRRRMIVLAERFDSMVGKLDVIENRFGMIEARMASIDRRQAVLEQRMDAAVDRISRLEGTADRILLLVERIAKAQGIGGEL